MRVLFFVLLAFPSLVFAQTDIPKKSNTIIISVDDPAAALKQVAKAMIKAGYEIEKDFDLGYLTGIYTQEAKPFKNGLQLKIKAIEEEGKIYVSGEFSIFQKGNGEFNMFDDIVWKGGKNGAWKSSFVKMEELVDGVGVVSYAKK